MELSKILLTFDAQDFVAMDLYIDGEYDPQFDTPTVSKWIVPADSNIDLDALLTVNALVQYYGEVPTLIKLPGSKYGC